MTVGVLYAGPRTDFGYNQAQADAAHALLSMPGLRLEEVDGAEGELAATAGWLSRGRGCRVVIVTAHGSDPSALLAQADAHRDAVFLICGAPDDPARLPANVGYYHAYLDEAQHVSGIVAGYAGRARRIGIVASSPVPKVLRCVNAFALGARRADPATAVRVLFVGEDAPPAAVAEAARALIAEGADVLAAQLDRPRPVCEVAEAAGVLCCGTHTDLSRFAPNGFLTGAEWAWERGHLDSIARLRADQPWPRLREGGFGAGLVRNTAYGPAVGVEARAHADAARMQLANGNAAVFRGPITDAAGRTVVPKGKALPSNDPALNRMVWLVEGASEAGR
ncbi:BMP family ABC transporter substrate-binding protein [Azospirillum thermophilum]|uniref:BMP family ABC transporter substrate-binding protein n=1 Tax=Azospirillum thermophilum TaxID=2202148 RepID=UPI001FE8B232|nr:BMP family ABC transporter substrate-binding protein [Azospirillum thermophilum]